MTAYTMNEAAAELRISRRNLQELVKDHPYFYSNGSRKLFTDGDIAALIQAMRPEPLGHSSLKRPSRPHQRYDGRSRDDVLEAARRLLAKKSDRRRNNGLKP